MGKSSGSGNSSLAGKGSRTPTKPHHTPSPEAQQSSPTAPSSPSLPPATTEIIPTPASLLGDDSQGEACPTVSGLEAGQDKATIIKSSTLPYDSTPRVTSLAADEGNMQQQLNELTDLYTRLQRQQTKMATKITAQDLEIASLKARIKMLEDKDGGVAEPSGADATIKGRSLETGKEAVVEKSTKRGSNDTEELVNVLTSQDAASILTSKVQVVSVPPAAEVATIARDAEIARIHTEEELQMLIDSLDRNNETIAKYLQEYEQFVADLSIGERIELINDLIEYFVPMGSKEEGDRVKRKGLKLEQESAKKVKTSEEVSEEDLKTMMQLVPIEEHFDREDLNQLWTLVKETLSIRQATSDKEKELWVELKILFEPDVEDQLDQEIFMLVEKDYPLRKGLAIVIISNKLQVENYSQMANDLILKIHKIANSQRQRGIPTASDEFPLLEDFPTASEERFPLL
nr:hypothetical protein [Tanacetum cinerariifolium]